MWPIFFAAGVHTYIHTDIHTDMNIHTHRHTDIHKDINTDIHTEVPTPTVRVSGTDIAKDQHERRRRRTKRSAIMLIHALSFLLPALPPSCLALSDYFCIIIIIWHTLASAYFKKSGGRDDGYTPIHGSDAT